MSEPTTLEQRVAALEREVAELKRRLALSQGKKNWIEAITGSMKDYPEFEEVVRLGREYRRSQKSP